MRAYAFDLWSYGYSLHGVIRELAVYRVSEMTVKGWYEDWKLTRNPQW